MVTASSLPVFLAGGLALVGLSLAFVLPALWRDARRAALVLLLGLPLAAAGLYAVFGTPDALDPRNLRAPETADEAARQLERRLADEPDSLEGWVLLGRTRKAQGRDAEAAGRMEAANAAFAGAVEAFAKARALAPGDPDLQVEAAEALSLADAGRRFGPEATALLDSALATVPGHPRGLWYRGIAALQAGDPAGAANRWEALLGTVDDATAAALRPQIDRVRAQAGLPPLPAEAAAPRGPGVVVRLTADPAAVARLPAGAVLFVSARDAANPQGPPVAARRIVAPTFPLELRLTDADRLMPTATLSATPRVLVSARYIASGAVDTAGADDLLAPPAEVAVSPEAVVDLALGPAR
ncbi:MAG: tetratricopeptide repeat protein [Lysobacteraceae bacterium]|jgi:cytochrome c-type biogenesis protein CcmH|nr:cytochrome C biogenesis protein [Xanthomonadaceae bacterium]MCZ8317583.1 cytochrome C biogenesis protein [Silanimonas sp.]